MPSNSYCEMASRRRECERADGRLECEMMEGDPTSDICEYGPSIFVNGDEKVTPRCEAYAGDIFAMGEWKGM